MRKNPARSAMMAMAGVALWGFSIAGAGEVTWNGTADNVYATGGPASEGSWSIDYGNTGWRPGAIVKLDPAAKLLYVRFPANTGTVVMIR